MSDVKNRIGLADAPTIASIIAADLMTRCGIKADPTPVDARESRGGGILFDLAIPQDFGVFAPVMRTAVIRVQADDVSDGTTWVKVDLAWTHGSGGSNGCTIGRWWIADGEIVNFGEF